MGAALAHLPRAIALVWEATRAWTTAWALLLLVQGLLPAATVYLTKPLIDSLTLAVGSGGAGSATALRPVLFWGGLMVVLMLVGEVLRECAGLVQENQSELLHDHISTLIYQQS